MAKKSRGRKKDQKMILCHMSLIEYKKEDCILISCSEYNCWVSLVWWEAHKKKEPYKSKWKPHRDYKQYA